MTADDWDRYSRTPSGQRQMTRTDPVTTPEPGESATLAEDVEVERLTNVLCRLRTDLDHPQEKTVARAVLASTWLADHDKRVRDEALAEVAKVRDDVRNAARKVPGGWLDGGNIARLLTAALARTGAPDA